MKRSRTLLALAGVLLGCLLLPSAASATLTYGSEPRGSVTGTVSWIVTGSAEPVDAIWLQVDGATPAYTSPVTWPVTLSVDTSTLAEGPHTFAVVTDGDAGTLVRRTWSLTVDRTAPAAPVPVGATQITTDRSSVMLHWTPPAGETSASAEGKVCDAAGCRAFAHHRNAFHVQLAGGVTTVSVWLRDLAGNADPARAATWTIVRTARAPAARINPGLRIVSAAVRPDRRTVSVTGTLRVPHMNRVSVSVRARFGNRTRTVRTVAVTNGHDFRAHLVLPSARWRTATVTARVAGSSRYLTVEKRRQVRRPGQRSRKR